jgi:hypothetical protein
MNCFRHPDKEAVVFCKGCGKPLCWDCAEQMFGTEKHVCSEVCAKRATARAAVAPSDAVADGLVDTRFSRVFAAVYSTVLVAVIGGISGGFLFSFYASLAYDRIQHPPKLYGYGADLTNYRDPRSSIFTVFFDLGITDWRAWFAIGAVLGIGCVVLYFKVGKAKMLFAFLALYLLLQIVALWK